jgi:hypothetical protein
MRRNVALALEGSSAAPLLGQQYKNGEARVLSGLFTIINLNPRLAIIAVSIAVHVVMTMVVHAHAAPNLRPCNVANHAASDRADGSTYKQTGTGTQRRFVLSLASRCGSEGARAGND